MRAGIYKILNTANQKFYIGSTNDLDSRFKEHKYLAKTGQHSSVHFQNAWNKYGESAFKYEVIEECSPDARLEREQHYLDTLRPWDPNTGYNIAKIVGSPPPPPNKPIERVDILTGEIKWYRTRDEAASEGFNEGSITACCLGNAETHSGYYWQYEDGSSPKFVSAERVLPVERLEAQTGEVLEIYASATEAVKIGGFNQSSISACCVGKLQTHGGFRWRYKDDANLKLAEVRQALHKISSGAQTDLEALVPQKINSVKFFNSREVIDNSAHQFTNGKSTPVDRIDPKTGEFKSYASMGEAVKDGFNQSKISACCAGKRNTHGGFIWKFSDAILSPDKIEDIKSQRTQQYRGAIKRTDEKTGEVKIYESQEAAEAEGFSQGCISLCCTGKRGSHKGFKWSYLNDPAEEFVPKRKSAVKRIDINTGETKEYRSQADAAAEGFSAGKISACCLGRRKSHKGYKWEFV